MSSSKEKSSVKQNRMLEVWKQFRRNRGAMIGLVVLIFLILIAVFADVIWDYDTDITAMQVGDRLLKPCLAHPFGTDNYGRDMLARIGYGTRYSLAIGFASVFMGSAVGVPLGALAGYIGGKFDTILMRFIDTFTIIPSLLMTIILVSVLGTNLFNLMLALSISTMPVMTRITRASVMVTRNNDYVESARAIGAPVHVILLQHVLPNCFSPILVQATLAIASAIIAEASLSFLGLGQQPPNPSWGSMLNTAKGFLEQAPWMSVFPGVAIFLAVQGFNLLGDGLRDALDPRHD